MADLNIGNLSASVVVNSNHNGDVSPQQDITYNLGTSTLRWKEAHVENFYGNLTGDVTGNISGNADTVDNEHSSAFVHIAGAETITGNKTFTGNLYIAANGAGGMLNGAATNGGLNSIKIGDDVWLGDVNSGGILGLKAATSTTTQSGIWLYNGAGTQIGKFYADGTNLVANKTLAPDAKGSYDIGTSAYPWRDAYLRSVVITNTNDVQIGRFFMEALGANGDGTAAGTAGKTVLELGNATATSTSATAGANNSYGILRLYGSGTGSAELYYDNTYLRPNKNIYFTNGGTSTTGWANGIRGQVASNDYWRVGGGATASDAGYLELATADGANEPIYVRQYSGTFTTENTTLTLLDGSHNTIIPNALTVGTTTSQADRYKFYVNGKSMISNAASTATNLSSQLIVTSGETTAGGNVALELWRGTNASWQFANESGVLYIRNNYTSTRQDSYTQNGLIMDYNTGAASLPYLALGQTARNTSYRLYVNGVSYFKGNVTHEGNILPNSTGTRSLGSGDSTTPLRWKDLFIGTANSYGGTAQPIYWKDGVPTALSATVGASAQPVYLSSGVITASTSSIGSATKPVYMNAGTITVCNNTLDVSISGNAATATKATGDKDGNAIDTTYLKKRSLIETSTTSVTTGTTAGTKSALTIYGTTYGNDAAYIKTAGQLSYGDPGPQIVFSTSAAGTAQSAALIFTDHDTIGAGVSLSLVSNQTDAYFIAPHIKALTGFVGNLSGTATNATNIYSSASTAKAYVLGTTTASSANHATVYNASVYTQGSVLYGAAWNDYAEYRETKEEVEPGRCVIEVGDGSLTMSFGRLQPGANIVSDTFGFAIGETETSKTPLAVSGRALVYPNEPIHTYHPGDPVCSGPNGTISKMTREEVREYPDRIVGTVSEVPTYETWGAGNVPVNGRIWIRIR